MGFATLTGMHVHNVKGISDLDIECRFHANKPNFLVAPNGSGKSSLAMAFDSLNRQRLKLDDANLRRDTDGSTASLEVRFSDGKTFRADAQRNEFVRGVDVSVINSGLYARQVTGHYGGHAYSHASIRVPDIEVYKKVPERKSVDYSVTAWRKEFPRHIRRQVSNLTKLLKKPAFLSALVECDLRGIGGKRNARRVEDFLQVLEDASERKTDWAKLDLTGTRIEEVAPVAKAAEILEAHMPHENRAALLLDAVQVCRLCERKRHSIRAANDRLEYENTKHEIDDLLASINTTGMELSSKVEKGRLVVRLPEWSGVSNGEMDVLKFAAALIRARVLLRKDLSILVIDEVFDYLDDANLIVAQHYLLKMMEHYKSLGKALYVIILTHLDPALMKSYRFTTKHVGYFSPASRGSVRNYIRSLIADRARCHRSDSATYEDVSGHFLHYHPDASEREETVQYLLKKGFPSAMRGPEGFRGECRRELDSYLSGGAFDIAMVCCALRVCVEERAYRQLKTEDARNRFLDAHGTEEKLNLAKQEGADVPELHYLLGGVYNACMHFSSENADAQLGITGRELCNGAIRRMIETAVLGCDDGASG